MLKDSSAVRVTVARIEQTLADSPAFPRVEDALFSAIDPVGAWAAR